MAAESTPCPVQLNQRAPFLTRLTKSKTRCCTPRWIDSISERCLSLLPPLACLAELRRWTLISRAGKTPSAGILPGHMQCAMPMPLTPGSLIILLELVPSTEYFSLVLYLMRCACFTCHCHFCIGRLEILPFVEGCLAMLLCGLIHYTLNLVCLPLVQSPPRSHRESRIITIVISYYEYYRRGPPFRVGGQAVGPKSP